MGRSQDVKPKPDGTCYPVRTVLCRDWRGGPNGWVGITNPAPLRTYGGWDSLIGIWRNRQGHRLGEIKLHGDGSFYAEYDVALQHPNDARWFVECVVAWGRDGVIKTEARRLPAL